MEINNMMQITYFFIVSHKLYKPKLIIIHAIDREKEELCCIVDVMQSILKLIIKRRIIKYYSKN